MEILDSWMFSEEGKARLLRRMAKRYLQEMPLSILEVLPIYRTSGRGMISISATCFLIIFQANIITVPLIRMGRLGGKELRMTKLSITLLITQCLSLVIHLRGNSFNFLCKVLKKTLLNTKLLMFLQVFIISYQHKSQGQLSN